MALDIDDEMQADQIKNFWDTYKKIITIGFVILIVAYISFQFYLSSTKKNSELASQLYQEIIIEKPDSLDSIKEMVASLKDNHSSTPYAARGAIYLSRILVDKKMNDEAVIELIWAGDNAKEKSIQSLAFYSLANIYLTSNDVENAKITANKISSPGYSGLKNDLLGDVYLISNDKEMAKASYKSALAFYENKSELAKVIQIKLDAIGQ